MTVMGRWGRWEGAILLFCFDVFFFIWGSEEFGLGLAWESG